MPSTYSKRWKKRKFHNKETSSEDPSDDSLLSSPGGPIRRKGDQAKFWDEAIGKSLEVIPATKLPSIRVVLQRYRSLRIDQPDTAVRLLAEIIADKVILIWNKARVPTAVRINCVTRVKDKIDAW